jgi:sigma-B regulation protein RsbU (phosphoserine phosphatase)
VLKPADARILVVDDSENNRSMLVRRLQRLGYSHIEEAANGQEALDKNGACAFDVMLLDVMMPVLSGIEVLQILRREHRLEETPVIMISAATEIDTVVLCLELGAEDHLPKPFDAALLRARLSSVIEKKALRMEVRRQLGRLEAELAEARMQQLSMVPSVFPCAAGAVRATVHAVMYPAREVGGDLYDVFMLGEEALCIVVGDVSDKGMSAALFMARTRSLLRATTLQLFRSGGASPLMADVMAVLNEELNKNNPFCMFVTLFLAVLDLTSGVLRYVNAGHLRPYVLSRDGGATELAGIPEPPAGALECYRHQEAELRLESGEGLVVITDGLPDAIDPAGHAYTLQQVAHELTNLASEAPKTITEALVTRIAEFTNGTPASDDITVLALRLGERVHM